jgi:hypothetical protein
MFYTEAWDISEEEYDLASAFVSTTPHNTSPFTRVVLRTSIAQHVATICPYDPNTCMFKHRCEFIHTLTPVRYASDLLCEQSIMGEPCHAQCQNVHITHTVGSILLAKTLFCQRLVDKLELTLTAELLEKQQLLLKQKGESDKKKFMEYWAQRLGLKLEVCAKETSGYSREPNIRSDVVRYTTVDGYTVYEEGNEPIDASVTITSGHHGVGYMSRLCVLSEVRGAYYKFYQDCEKAMLGGEPLPPRPEAFVRHCTY